MKSVIVTGASSGIGLATARAFLEAGWRVGCLARRAAPLEELTRAHPAAVPLAADVTDAAAVEAAFERFQQQAGRLDVLFNNAGSFGPAGLVDEISPADWRAVIDTNVTGMFLCARAAFARMRRQDPQGGRIINNGSISAHVPRPRAAAYTASKHAVTGLTRQLSLDGRDFGIACGQIDIGNARTPLLEQAIAASPQDPPPVMEVREVAATVLHMAELPPEANMQFVTLMATTMPYIGRG